MRMVKGLKPLKEPALIQKNRLKRIFVLIDEIVSETGNMAAKSVAGMRPDDCFEFVDFQI